MNRLVSLKALSLLSRSPVTSGSRLVAASRDYTKFSLSGLLKKPLAASETSTKRSLADSAPVAKPADQAAASKPQWERPERFRIFWGYDYENEAEDKLFAHFATFIGILTFICLPVFILRYYPDFKTNEWCYREAHLELARREAAGLPLVDPELIPVDRIQLPSDEELGDTKIII